MRIKIILSLLSIAIFNNNYGESYLIGISNNTTSASGTKPRINIRGETQSVAYSKFRAADKKLPAYIDLVYGIGANAKTYTIVVKKDDSGTPSGCQGNSHVIVAQIQDAPVGAPNTIKNICIPSTISTSLGSNAMQWQTVFLAIADNPNYKVGSAPQDPNALPFSFGLSSWTSTQKPWDQATISIIPDSNIALKKPLNVIQGYAGWGGDQSLPRFGFGHIADVYNNTPYILNFHRQSMDPNLAKSDFNNLVPPMSVVPKAMAWIPKDGQSAITIYAMHAPSKDSDNTLPPPPGFDPISKAGNVELDPTPQSVKDIILGIESSIPSLTEELTGQPTLTGLISDKYNQYSVSQHYFKIFSTSDKNIHIQRCDKKTHQCISDEIIKLPATNAAGVPNFFRLVVEKDNKYGIKLNIQSIASNAMQTYLGKR